MHQRIQASVFVWIIGSREFRLQVLSELLAAENLVISVSQLHGQQWPSGISFFSELFSAENSGINFCQNYWQQRIQASVSLSFMDSSDFQVSVSLRSIGGREFRLPFPSSLCVSETFRYKFLSEYLAPVYCRHQFLTAFLEDRSSGASLCQACWQQRL